MNEMQASALEAIVGDEAWQSGGGIWVVTVNREDGKLIVFSGDAVCEYDSDVPSSRSMAPLFQSMPLSSARRAA